MLILGLDPGSIRTGYGLIESRPGRLRAIDFGTIVPPRGLALLDRLPHIAGGLRAVTNRVRPDAVAAEDVFVAKNARTALKLGEVRGAILLPLLEAGIPIHEYAPRLVRRAVTGYGGADKPQVRRMVCLLLGLRDADLALDASDALAVAICHAHSGAGIASRAAARG